MKKYKPVFLLFLSLPVLAALSVSCRMDNKDNVDDYSHYSNEDKAKLDTGTAASDGTKVEKNDTLH